MPTLFDPTPLPDGTALEAGLAKATFSGLIMDLIATGERKRLTAACDAWLDRLSQIIRTANQ